MPVIKKDRALVVTIGAILVSLGALLPLLYYHNLTKSSTASIKPLIHKTNQFPEKIITPGQKTEFAKQVSAPPITGRDMFEKPEAAEEAAAPDIIVEDVADDPLIAENMRQNVEKLHIAHLPPKPVYELIEEEVKAMNGPAREESDKLDRIAREGRVSEGTDERNAE